MDKAKGSGRSFGGALPKIGEALPRIGETDADVGGRICAFLRGIYPEKTAANVCADTAISPKTVENWLAGVAAPRSIHFVRLFLAYGPEFLRAAAGTPPAWLDEACQTREREQLARQIAALQAREAALREAAR